MKFFTVLMLVVFISVCGCKKPFWKKSAKPSEFGETKFVPKQQKQSAAKESTSKQPPNTLQSVLYGRVRDVNEKARFAILNFPVGKMPPLGQLMWIYRDGQRVGRVKITGPQMDLNVAADILEGEAQTGDEVRIE